MTIVTLVSGCGNAYPGVGTRDGGEGLDCGDREGLIDSRGHVGVMRSQARREVWHESGSTESRGGSNRRAGRQPREKG
jgi:hypothetical protein